MSRPRALSGFPELTPGGAAAVAASAGCSWACRASCDGWVAGSAAASSAGPASASLRAAVIAVAGSAAAAPVLAATLVAAGLPGCFPSGLPALSDWASASWRLRALARLRSALPPALGLRLPVLRSRSAARTAPL